MWPSAKFIDENVAFSRMPTEKEIDEVAEEFDAVVVLVEEHEVPYSLEEWRKRGVEVSPQSDFRLRHPISRPAPQNPSVD